MRLIYNKLSHTVSTVVYVSIQIDACMVLQVMGPGPFCVLSSPLVDVVPVSWHQSWVDLVSSLLHFNTISLVFGELNSCDLSMCQSHHCFLLLFDKHSQTWINQKNLFRSGCCICMWQTLSFISAQSRPPLFPGRTRTFVHRLPSPFLSLWFLWVLVLKAQFCLAY